MEQLNNHPSKDVSNTPSITHVESPNQPHLEPTGIKNEYLIPTSIGIIKVRYTAHHLKWSWQYANTTNRVPIKSVRYRGWSKYIHSFKGKTIVLNYSPKKELNIMELWLKSRYYNPTRKASGVIRMIYANWSKADLIARQFSEFAQIAIKPIHTAHPADIEHAHLVMTTKALNPILKPMSEVKDDVGLIFDQSHPNLPEFTGEKSVEGAQGAEWFFTKFPLVVQKQIEMDERYAKNLELHLSVLTEMKDKLGELGEAIRKLKEEQL